MRLWGRTHVTWPPSFFSPFLFLSFLSHFLYLYFIAGPSNWASSVLSYPRRLHGDDSTFKYFHRNASFRGGYVLAKRIKIKKCQLNARFVSHDFCRRNVFPSEILRKSVWKDLTTLRAVHTFLTNIFEFSIEKGDLIDELEGHLFVYKSSQSVEPREKKLLPLFLILSSQVFYNLNRLYIELPAHFSSV